MSTETHATTLGSLSGSSRPPVDVVPAAGEDISATFIGHPARPKVMMVDDEKLNSFVIAEYLKADGYRDMVYTADPFEAMPLARHVLPDVILLDLQMPEVSGLDILRELRGDEAFARTAVIILTASTDEKERTRAIELGANGFIHKGIQREELLAQLRSVTSDSEQNQGR